MSTSNNVPNWFIRYKETCQDEIFFGTGFSFEELQTYVNFDLHDVLVFRPKNTLTPAQKTLLADLKSLEDKSHYRSLLVSYIGEVVKVANGEGYYVQGNEHTILILSNKDDTEDALLHCHFDEQKILRLVEVYFTGDIEDYLVCDFTIINSKETTAVFEKLYFERSKTTVSTKLLS